MIGTLTVCSYNAYALLEPRSNLLYVTPFVAGKFSIIPKLLSEPFYVSTPVGEPFIARKLYLGCTLVVCNHHSSADLIELEMVYFDIIMSMD